MRESYADLARKSIAVNQANLALGCEVFRAERATFVRNRSAPYIRDLNHVREIEAEEPEEIERLLQRAEREFEGFPYRRFDITPSTASAFEARLLLDGYARFSDLIMVLRGELRASVKAHRIEIVDNDAAWEAVRKLKDVDQEESARKAGRPVEQDVAAQMVIGARSKVPPLRYWLAFAGDEPCGHFSSWEGPDGVGQVEDLFVHPDYRHRGIATALMATAVADCRSHGAGPVAIVCDPNDTPKGMYAAMGFEPIAVKRAYRRTVLAGGILPSGS
jgi:GNAT superfamily N-acetyltransferase